MVVCVSLSGDRWDVHLTKDRSRARCGGHSLARRAMKGFRVSECQCEYRDHIVGRSPGVWISYCCTCACDISLAISITNATQCDCPQLTIMAAL